MATETRLESVEAFAERVESECLYDEYGDCFLRTAKLEEMIRTRDKQVRQLASEDLIAWCNGYMIMSAGNGIWEAVRDATIDDVIEHAKLAALRAEQEPR